MTEASRIQVFRQGRLHSALYARAAPQPGARLILTERRSRPAGMSVPPFALIPELQTFRL
jgi:hypothetical protein